MSCDGRSLTACVGVLKGASQLSDSLQAACINVLICSARNLLEVSRVRFWIMPDHSGTF